MNPETRWENKWETFAHEADIGMRGTGATLAEAFAGAATAMTAAICDPAKVGHPLPRSLSRKGRGKLSASSLPLRERGRERGIGDAVIVTCEAPDAEMLLVDWLNALVYEMATRHMLFSRFEVSVEDCHLKATAWGVPGVIFASRELIAGMDEKVREQVANVASLPGIVTASYAGGAWRVYSSMEPPVQECSCRRVSNADIQRSAAG